MYELTEKKDNLTEQEIEAVTDDAETESAKSGKKPPNVEEVSKNRWWLKYVITAGVHVVVGVLVALARGAFTAKNQMDLLSALSDAFFVPGILGIAFGLIIVASNGGAFDMLAYGIKMFFRLFTRDPLDRKYGGYYEYRQARKEKKRSFWFLMIVGAVFLAIGIVLFAWYYAVYRI